MSARRILVVDDNVDAADITAEFLTMQGFEVRTAYGGVSALAMARQFAPEVIFLDLGMPGKDGYAVATELLQDPRAMRPRLVALTAWGDAAARSRCASIGFDAHLVKPTDLFSLLGEATKEPVAH